MDWKTIVVGAILSAIVAIPFGIFGNLITPWVKSAYERSIFSSKQRRIDAILADYRRINNTGQIFLSFSLM